MSNNFQVQKAREIIQMESSQQCTLEERLGKSTQQSSSGEGGTKESYIKNQFSTWDFPKPGASQEEEGMNLNIPEMNNYFPQYYSFQESDKNQMRKE